MRGGVERVAVGLGVVDAGGAAGFHRSHHHALIGDADARHVRRAFARAASTYEAHAVLQAEVGVRLLERLDGVDLQPSVVLDAGSGPGVGASALRARFPDAHIIALDLALPMLHAASARAGEPPAFACVAADAQALPLADASVDLVYSNLCLQWCDDPGLVLAEFARVLRPDGFLLFTSFGPSTLYELRAAVAEIAPTIIAAASATPFIISSLGRRRLSGRRRFRRGGRVPSDEGTALCVLA